MKPEIRAKRKYTDRVRRFLIDLYGDWRAEQPFRVIHHPRAFNKPLSCQLGKHDLVVKSVMGIPFYYCKKCGWGLPKGIVDGVETKREIRTRHVPKPPASLSERDLVEEYYRMVNKEDE